MTFSFEIAQAKAADILSVAQQHGAQLRKFGGERVGPCPVCGGRDRFSINPKRQIWNCRGWGKGGDVIALVQHVMGIGFLDAVRELVGGKAGPIARGAVKPPEPSPPTDPATTTSGAGAMWREGVEPRGTAVERYLNSRALALDEDLAGEVIRFHRGENAMLALFRDITSDEPESYLAHLPRPERRQTRAQVSGSGGRLRHQTRSGRGSCRRAAHRRRH